MRSGLPVNGCLSGAPEERKMRSDSRKPRFQNVAGGKSLRVGLPPSARTAAPSGTKRSLSCPLLVGQTGVNSEPTALAAGTAGPAGSARTRSRDQSLENPFLGNRRFLRRPRPPKRRRRQAPARGPAAVYFYHRSNRNETQHTHPLLVGWVCVYPAPTALAAGTAGPPPAHGVGVRLPRAEGTGRRHCRPRVWGWRCRLC